jgi:hypothetical protein
MATAGDEETANNRMIELQVNYNCKGYDVREYELNTPAKHPA